MLCFGISSSVKDLSIVLAEETIIYRTFRNDGIDIVGTIIVNLPEQSSKPIDLGVWHRVKVDNFNFSTTNELLDDSDFYTRIFSKICKGRARILQDEECISFRPFGEQMGRIVPLEKAVRAYVLNDRDMRVVGNDLPEVDDAASVPFTYHEIEIPETKHKTIALRLRGRIEEPSLSRLVFEDYSLKKRYYPIHGSDYICDEIESGDLPKLFVHYEKQNKLKEFYRWEKFYTSKLSFNRKIPEYYSVVVIDKDMSGNDTFAVKINSGTRNLGRCIAEEFLADSAVYYWFVSNKNVQNFKLRFEGTMKSHDIENKSAEYSSLVHQMVRI
jgi:hypothetical protein